MAHWKKFTFLRLKRNIVCPEELRDMVLAIFKHQVKQAPLSEEDLAFPVLGHTKYAKPPMLAFEKSGTLVQIAIDQTEAVDSNILDKLLNKDQVLAAFQDEENVYVVPRWYYDDLRTYLKSDDTKQQIKLAEDALAAHYCKPGAILPTKIEVEA